jgi:uncharacterized protein
MTEVGAAGEHVLTHAPDGDGPPPPVLAAAAEPTGVLLGAGGDPLMVGLPIFCVGSLALAFALVGVVSPAGLGTIIPVVLAATAVFQLVSVVWAIFLGQSIVASILALFSGFWGSLAIFLLGVYHGWFAIPAADVVHAQELFFISWDILFLFLTVICLRLPVIYPAIVGLVVAALTCVVLGLEFPGGVSTWDHVAGICVFAFAGLGFLAWMNVGSVSLGGPAWPPLGRAVVR